MIDVFTASIAQETGDHREVVILLNEATISDVMILSKHFIPDIHYPKEAHVLLANNKTQYAPKLYGCQMFKPWFQVVVMEWIQDAEYFSMKTHNALGKALRNAVSILHDENWVHGDIRDANVLVKEDKVYLIDFEWAGNVKAEDSKLMTQG